MALAMTINLIKTNGQWPIANSKKEYDRNRRKDS